MWDALREYAFWKYMDADVDSVAELIWMHVGSFCNDMSTHYERR